MLFHATFALVSANVALTKVGDRCNGHGGAIGVCTYLSDCDHYGGVTIYNGCPNDPANVRCCTKEHCQGTHSECGWGCYGGHQVKGHCPGPSNYLCCVYYNQK